MSARAHGDRSLRVTDLEFTSAFGALQKRVGVQLLPPLTRMTHLRHWLCTAPIVSVPIKVPVSADAMLSSELGNRYAATRVHHVGRRHRGGLAACGARAAAGEKPQGRTAPSGGVYESTLKIRGSLRIDLESDPVASGLGVAVVSKPS